jgi:phosphopantothenoylcysteine decarboxylase/phosphopantothenate--cysteine ligase
MRQASMNSNEPVGMIRKRPYLFMVAAVADYTPAFPQNGKLKKAMLGEKWELTLTQTPDILSTLNKDGVTTIAFKAEMDPTHGLEHAKTLLDQKEVDAVCYNLLSNSGSFGTDSNEIEFITPDHITPLGKADKLTLTAKILDEARKLTDE